MNRNNFSQSLYEKWEKTWARDKSSNMTFIGKKITKAKQKGLKEILKRINTSSVIDVGCGLGYSLEIFKNLGLSVIGIDVSPTAVKVCKKKGFNVFHKKLEDVKEKYDLVFSDGLLEHFLDFGKYVQYLTNVSKRYVLIIQTDHETLIVRFLLLLETLLREGKNMYEYNYRIEDYIDTFNRFGFKLKEIKGVYMNGFKLLLFEKA